MKTFRNFSENISGIDDIAYAEEMELDEGAISTLSKVAILTKIRGIAKQVERIRAVNNDTDQDTYKKVFDQNKLIASGMFWLGALMIAVVAGIAVRK